MPNKIPNHLKINEWTPMLIPAIVIPQGSSCVQQIVNPKEDSYPETGSGSGME